VLAKFLVTFYFFVHGRLHLPGAGWLIRRVAPYCHGLQRFSLNVPGIGTALLDFRDLAAMGWLNYRLGEHGTDIVLYTYMARFLRPDSVLWDIGANIGTLTAYFASPKFALRSIEAFEPNPNLTPSLQALFSAHPRVHVHSMGLGHTNSELELHLGCSSSLSSIKRKFDTGRTIRVPIFQGDGALEKFNLPLPDVIKVDVEGFEAEVFTGLQNTIRTRRPVIFFEHLFFTDEQIRQMIPERYEIRLLLDDGRITADFGLRTLGHDAVLIPEERLGDLDHAFPPGAPTLML
jgi:FkbM family methyltransferase